MPPYTVKPLVYELSESALIYFEEGLYINGLDFLTSLLTSGVASNNVVHLPSTSFLGLISTLSVHPNFTNRTKDAETAKVSVLANRYLRLVSELVEPTSEDLSEAYGWPEISLTRRGFARRRRDDEHGEGPDGADAVHVHSPYAEDKSIFAKTSDFWAAVGWAFRCSVLHPNRWPAWELWLEHMIGVLERDLNERFDPDAVTKSLIAKYVKGMQQRTRILRAIFADGSDRFANEFQEVWRNETKPRAEKKKDVTIKKIDLENDEFGDYLDVSSDDEKDVSDDARTITAEEVSKRKRSGPKQESDATAQLGGHAATKLRMRLLGLIIRLTTMLPGHFGGVWAVYDLCLEYLKPLPLPAFSVITSPPMLDPLHEESATSLMKYMAQTLLQSGAKSSKQSTTPQDALVECYLPYAANTNLYVDNAKLSICLEVLMRMLDLQRKLQWDAALEMAVEQGIERRMKKATTAKGKKGEASGETDLEHDKTGLQDSSMRLRMLVHLNKIATEKTRQAACQA